MIHTPLGFIEDYPEGWQCKQAKPDGWRGWLEIGPRSDAPGPDAPIKKIEGRTREQLMQRMLAEARFQMNLLGEMIHWAENQEWARRKGK